MSEGDQGDTHLTHGLGKLPAPLGEELEMDRAAVRELAREDC